MTSPRGSSHLSRTTAIGAALFVLLTTASPPAASAEQGAFFAKKAYDPRPLPTFEATRDKLPSPIFDEDPSWVACYWKAWELAFRNFHEPAPGSGYVSRFIDAAFNQNIFLWDTAFMTMFCNWGHPHVPGIGSLDNFYSKQHPDGEICREIDRATGKDFGPWVNAERESLFSRWGYGIEGGTGKVAVEFRGRARPEVPPILTLDALNHPILAWAEVESHRITGDTERLRLVWKPLVRYFEALDTHIRQGNGLYLTDWASMDNSPRNGWLARGGTAIDTSAEMVLFARNLAEIGQVIGEDAEARRFASRADEVAKAINERMWDPERRFYFDLDLEGKRSRIKTIAAFWTLVAGVASGEQAEALVAELEDPRTFKTAHRVPTLAADQEGFDAESGSYWRGSVWVPTNTMVIRGLERYGREELARDLAMNHLASVARVFRETGTVWENYAPQRIAPGRPAKGDFVGWSGLGPIGYLLEYGVGVRCDAPKATVTWTIVSPRRVGVERLGLGGRTVSLVCEEPDAEGRRTVRARADAAFTLIVRRGKESRELRVPAGEPVELRW